MRQHPHSKNHTGKKQYHPANKQYIRAFNGHNKPHMNQTAPKLVRHADSFAGALLGQFERVWPAISDNRSRMCVMLSKKNVQPCMTTKSDAQITQVNKETGQIMFDPRECVVFPLYKSQNEMVEYYMRQPNLSPNAKNLLDNLYTVKEDELRYNYYTSFSLIPEGKLAGNKVCGEYNLLHQTEGVARFTSEKQDHYSPLTISASDVFPVFACLMNAQEANSILESYQHSPFYYNFVKHVLWVLHNLTLRKRFEDGRVRGIKISDGSISKPSITYHRSPSFFTTYAASHAINTYDVCYNASLPMNNVSWEDLDPNLPAETKSEDLVSLNLQITITTHTSKPIMLTSEFNSFEENIKKAQVREKIVGQEIVVTGRYIGSHKSYHNPNCHLRFVTVNGGAGISEEDENDYKHKANEMIPRVIFMKFGYGMPLQMEISETQETDIPSFFGQMFPNVPIEKVIMNMNGVVSRMLDLAFHDEKDKRWETYKSDAEVFGRNCIWFPKQNISNMPKATKIIAQSMKKNFDHRLNAKQNDPEGLFSYHYHSMCSRNYGFLVEGSHVCNKLHMVRAVAVYFYWPVGIPLSYSWTPDHVVERQMNSKVFRDFFQISDASVNKDSPINLGNGQALAAAFHDDIDINEIMVSASRPSVFDEEVYM